MAKTSDEAKVERLVLDVGGKKVELSLEQAQNLFGALNSLFGKKETVKHEHHYGDPWWRRPWLYDNRATLRISDVETRFRSGTLHCKV